MIENQISQKIIEDGQFENVYKNLLGQICFALPIPEFNYSPITDANGDVQFSDFEWDMLSDAWEKFVKKKLKDDKEGKYRTKNTAGEIVEVNSSMPVITSSVYQNAMTLNKDETAYLQQIETEAVENLKFENGKLYFKGMVATVIDLKNKFNNRDLSNIDLPLLRTLYSIILNNIKIDPQSLLDHGYKGQILGYTVTVYMPDFMKMIGLEPNFNKASIGYTVAKISNFNNILGIMTEYAPEYGRTFQSIYPVMLFMGYDTQTNTISFASPYMNVLIWRVLQESIKKDSQGKPKLNKKGKYILAPSHSYLIKSSLAKERNVRAAEIVNIVVTLIEQAGKNTPHIKASTIIERHAALKQALDEMSTASNKNRLLKTTFSAAWKYLRKHTRLKEVYPNIKLPDENVFPTMTTLDMVFEFPHDGKNKNSDSVETKNI